MEINLSHQELSLLLFALEGGQTPPSAAPSCEEVCPIVENIEETLCGKPLDFEKQLARHLGEHLRQGLIDCGIFELMSLQEQGALSTADQAKLRESNERLRNWSCTIKLNDAEKQFLLETCSRLPRAAWLSMPRTLWRLRKKLASRASNRLRA